MSNSNVLKRVRLLLFLGLLIAAAVLAFNRQTAVQAETSGSPTSTFSTYYGGGGQECLFDRCAIAVDADGYIYVAGTTTSGDFPTVNPYAVDNSDGSGNDIFVVKLTPGGADVVYSTYVGNGIARGITVDSSGNAIVVGDSIDNAFPTTADAYDDCVGNGTDIVLFKLSSDGQALLYGSCIGGSGVDQAYDVALDDNGRMVVVGNSKSADFPTQSAAQNSLAGQEDAIIFKLASNGVNSSLIFSTFLGGSSRDYAWSVAVNGNTAYVGGRTGSDNFPVTPGVLQSERFSGAGTDGFVAQFSNNGNLNYSTFYNETSTNEVVDIAVDADGNAYFVSLAREAVKLNSTATAVGYRAEIDVRFGVEGEGSIALDSNNNAYITGYSAASPGDLVLTAVHHSGAVVYRQTIGGSGGDQGLQIGLHEHDDQVDAYMVGVTYSTNFPKSNALQTNRNGSQDMVLLNVTGLETAVNPTYIFLPMVTKP